MIAEKKLPKARCIRCGADTDTDADTPNGAADEVLCSRCYEKMMFPETRLQNMEFID